MKSRLICPHFKENFEKIHIFWTVRLKPSVKSFFKNKKQVNLQQCVRGKLKPNKENQ